MKFPKNKANLYLVTRRLDDADSVVLAGFSDDVAAFDFKDACEQEWIDKVGNLNGVEFDVVLTTYYDA